MTEREKMVLGLEYYPGDEELLKMRLEARKKIRAFNDTAPENTEKQFEIIRSLFGSVGKNFYIEQGFRCDYGINIHVGEGFFANFNCVILDCAKVQIGKNCFLAPNVSIYTATHPLDPYDRISYIEFAKEITIGDNCWIGGNSVILPGVSLGNNVVVGGGSVVTKSFGDNVIIAGNPARIIKTINIKT